jgi:fructosamine-3-kinase
MGSDDPLLTLGKMLLNQLDLLLTCEDEPAVLLHGDLWSGNAAANEKGEPVIFDPASYYGHREAEIGMMRLFGGFSRECEDAYQEVWPLQLGHDRRIEVYKLYHQLNHLNLFGNSYYNACLDTVRRLL